MRFFVTLSLWVGLLAGATSLYGAQAKVVKVEGKTVHLDVGSDRGMEVGMLADIYRQAEPIIHPVTGENLGSPRVKIGRIEIRKVEPTSAMGTILNQYAPVLPGDTAEGIDIDPTPEEQMQADVNEARAEIKALARSLADEIKANQKAIADLRRTLRRIGSSERRLTSLINTVKNMRERMVSIESKLTTLDEQQMEIIAQDTAEVGMMGPADVSELGVLKRESGDEVYIRVGNRMYRLSFAENRLIEEGEAAQIADAGAGEAVPPPAEAEVDAEVEDLFSEDPQEEMPWYKAYWWVALPVGLLLAVGLLLLKLMRRQRPEGSEEGEAGAEDGFQEVGDEEVIAEELPEPEAVEANGEQ